MKKKIFTLFSILVFMGTHSALGKEQTEADGPEPRKESYVQNTGNSDLLLKNQENFKIPISKSRYITGGVLATSAPVFLGLGVGLGVASKDLDILSWSLLAMIPGSFGIPRAVQGRYWPMGFLFTAIQGGLILIPPLLLSPLCSEMQCKEGDMCMQGVNAICGTVWGLTFFASIIWQTVDAWTLSSAYELAEKKQWGVTPTYSYSKETDSNAYGLALQYLW